MTTLDEKIALMDLLREASEIGAECKYPRGLDDHQPELCFEEETEYDTWETGLRANGGAAEGAFSLIRRLAKMRWERVHGEAYAGPKMKLRVERYCSAPRRDAQE